MFDNRPLAWLWGHRPSLSVTDRTVNCRYLSKLQMHVTSDPIFAHMQNKLYTKLSTIALL